jgi:Predicted acyl-CoA transferases/carnitine dehydratase
MKKIIPDFGPLKNVRVLCTGSIVAMPHAASLFADFGAQVIQIERPGVGDTYRGLAPFAKHDGKTVSTSWAQDARNRLSLTMEVNLNIPEIKEIFMGLIKETDIFLENMVWLDKLGINDEEMLKVNPKLVIIHISGYGRPQFGGVPEVADRASYDMIGQAYGGFMWLNGDPDRPPMLTKPWANDYISAMNAVIGGLCAYVHAKETGQGQVVDVAQFEAMGRMLSDTIVSYTEAGITRERSGTKAAAFQPYGLFETKDKRFVAIGTFGPAVYKRCIVALGLDPEYFNFKECSSSLEAVASPKGRELDLKIQEWCKGKDAAEIVEIINKAKVGCSVVNTPADVVNDPHWIGREDIIEYEDQTLGKKIKAFGIAPKLSATPGKVWRGAPTMGQDTDKILKELLGYDEAKIKELKEKKLI